MERTHFHWGQYCSKKKKIHAKIVAVVHPFGTETRRMVAFGWGCLGGGGKRYLWVHILIGCEGKLQQPRANKSAKKKELRAKFRATDLEVGNSFFRWWEVGGEEVEGRKSRRRKGKRDVGACCLLPWQKHQPVYGGPDDNKALTLWLHFVLGSFAYRTRAGGPLNSAFFKSNPPPSFSLGGRKEGPACARPFPALIRIRSPIWIRRLGCRSLICIRRTSPKRALDACLKLP